MTMQVIEHIEVGSGGAASITFSAIPADYTDLLVVASLRSTSTTSRNTFVYINGGSTNVSSRILGGDGSSPFSFSDPSSNFAYVVKGNDTANTFGNLQIYIPNYASNVAKSISLDAVTENNATGAVQAMSAGLWNSTAAITSITIDPEVGNLVEYSSATLYGITAGSDGTTTVS